LLIFVGYSHTGSGTTQTTYQAQGLPLLFPTHQFLLVRDHQFLPFLNFNISFFFFKACNFFLFVATNFHRNTDINISYCFCLIFCHEMYHTYKRICKMYGKMKLPKTWSEREAFCLKSLTTYSREKCLSMFILKTFQTDSKVTRMIQRYYVYPLSD
jgi:hypothetical protein